MEKLQKEINSKRDIVKEKFNELQDMAVTTMQMKQMRVCLKIKLVKHQ